ncbi:hypothetical protein Pflav_036700 [Phytohabitans flavus]|uniref:Uncharacterized protein n=1 Tax=Phytohabitans flavus TaxID=1076124 RepID=A0A6F8XTX2_9ACTN|nr:hypothetical protein Pflav_036700 [Phytohabitans flavus]
MDALDAAVRHLAAALVRGAVVEGDLALDAERLRFLGEDLRQLRVAQQRLRGMQPTLRQTPPQYFSSTTAVDRPSWAARTAAV